MHESGLTRRERREINKAAWAAMRVEAPLSSPWFDEAMIPEVSWKPGDGPTPEVVDAILGVLAQGPALSWICKTAREAGLQYPEDDTFYLWVDADPQLARRYARARERQGEALAWRMVEISSGAHRDEESRDKIGAVQRDKGHADSLRWYAGKVNARFNDKLEVKAEVEHKGGVLLVPGTAQTAEEWQAQQQESKS